MLQVAIPLALWALPREHKLHADASLDSENVPKPQSEQLLALPMENVPARQLSHEAPPVELRNLPEAHPVQELWPAMPWNVPTAQASQEIPPAADLKFPARQLEHADWPVLACTVPALHSRQAEDPVLGAYLPAGQLPHDNGLVLSVSEWNFPLSQRLHWDAPVVAWYVPGEQSVQTVIPEAD